MKIYSKRKREEEGEISKYRKKLFFFARFYYFPHSRQNLFRPAEQFPAISVENYFPMIFAGIPNEVILLPCSEKKKAENKK
jgi:hypothetical protein